MSEYDEDHNRKLTYKVIYENIQKVLQSSDDFFILIDGFGLILEIYSNRHLKWEQHGGVCLHYIYLLERYLKMFLQLKSHIKICFFEVVENIIRDKHPDLYLLLELTVLHLMSLPQFKDNIFIFKENKSGSYVDQYKTLIKEERISTYVTFNPFDLKIKASSLLEKDLRQHLNNLIKANLDTGVPVFLTKKFWHEIDSAKAFNITSIFYAQIDTNFSTTNYIETNNFIGKENFNRRDLYNEFINENNLTEHTKQALILQLNLLETLDLDHRAFESVDLLSKYNHLNKFLVNFKLYLARRFEYFNRNSIKHNEKFLIEICDIFDARLFFKSYEWIQYSGMSLDSTYFDSIRLNQRDNRELMGSVLLEPEDHGILFENWFKLQNNSLFDEYLKDFKFETEDENNNHISTKYESRSGIKDLANDQFSSFMEILRKKFTNRFQETKFSLYLEEYIKTFRFHEFKPTAYDHLKVKILEPEKIEAKSGSKKGAKNCVKKADLIINQNELNVFKKEREKDLKLVEQLKNELTIKGTDSSFLSGKIITCMKNAQTLESKLTLLKRYLDFILKELGSIKKNPDELINVSIEYYKYAEASIRAFGNLASSEQIKELVDQFNKDFRKIFKELEMDISDHDDYRHEFLKFQMEKCQFDLHKEYHGREDKRVEDFVPDKWQIDLIDAIDADKSVIVSAPTSSGKTFASFYAIEKVLKSEDPNGIAVYVAPSKSLINQMLAGVYSKFKKINPAKGKQLIGVFTRDHQQNIDSCRVLLLVPECLEILYTSIEGYKKVCKNFKYIIFDEFHNINDDNRGKIWERTVLLTTCPVLILSATIGNPLKVLKWLNEARTTMRSQMRSHPIISYLYDDQDLSDILKTIDFNQMFTNKEMDGLEKCLTDGFPQFKSLSKLKTIKEKQTKIIQVISDLNISEQVKERLRFDLSEYILIEYKQKITQVVYHVINNTVGADKFLKVISPLDCFNKSGKNTDLIIDQLSLVPRDTFLFYESIRDTFSGSEHPSVPELKDKGFISCNDVHKLELNLKSELKTKLAQESATSYEKLLKKLKTNESFSQKEFDFKQLPGLIEYMDKNNMLPCLCFGFDRTKVEVYTRALLDYYQEKEENLRSSKYKSKIDELNKKREIEEEAKRRLRDKMSKNKDNDDVALDEPVSIDYNMLDDYLDECVIGESRLFSKVEIEEKLNKAFEKSDWRREAIKRGFCYHHSGLNNKKRVCIESLFRGKYIKLIFCTTTLAQGLHIPCKTVLFLHDSSFLNSNIFKQCVGRAGRRGYDDHADVIFLNMPDIKIKQLLSSASANIKPNFILSPSFILKLLSLSSEEPDYLKQALSLLTNSSTLNLNLTQVELEKIQNKFYFIFCCQFLYENRFININGSKNKNGYSNLADRFSYHEPSNLALCYLIRSGALENMWNKETNNFDKQQKILLVLAYLFNQIYIFNIEEVKTRLKQNTYNSKIILGDLPEEIINSLEEYNDKIHDLYVQNIRYQNRLIKPEANHILPLSNYNFFKGHDLSEEIIDMLYEMNLDQDLKTDILSKFAGLSGLHDEHEDFHIKDKSILVHLKAYNLDYKNLYPTVDSHDLKDFHGNPIKLNSYLLDYFNHGIYKAIITENKMRDDFAYDGLADFKKILFCLSELDTEEDEGTFKNLSEKYNQIFEKSEFDTTFITRNSNKPTYNKFKNKLKPRLRLEKEDRFQV